MTVLPPERCETMQEVRKGVDALDRELVALLARRMGYMDAAARIKPDRSAVRDEPRKAEVIENARHEARRHGIDADLIGRLWDRLVEESIAYELDTYDSLAK